MAPPWVRCTSPWVSRRIKSRRMLAGEAESAAVRSSTEVLPCCSSRRKISLARISVFDDILAAHTVNRKLMFCVQVIVREWRASLKLGKSGRNWDWVIAFRLALGSISNVDWTSDSEKD